MPFRVDLPRKYWPTYPNMCVRCGKPDPTDAYDPVRDWLIKPSASSMAGDPLTATQPACRFCKIAIPIERWARRVVLAVLALAIFVTVQSEKGKAYGEVEYTDYGYAVCGTLVFFAVWKLLPSPIRISMRRSKLRYSFRKKSVGRAFKSLNRPTH